VTDYTVQYLDFAQLNGTGPEFELYAMEVSFADGSTKYYVMSKDEGFRPQVGDDLAVTTYSSFTSTTYGQIGAAICYAGGTPILTDKGEVPVEHLRKGDLIQTADNGCRSVLWIGRRDLGLAELAQYQKLRPILIRPGILGNTSPLIVSPQHRLLIQKAQFGSALPAPEAFVKAKHLAEHCKKISRIAHGKRSVSYYHILLDSHQVIFAGGVASESLYLGPMAIKGVSRTDRHELENIFPALSKAAGDAVFELARPTISRKVFRDQAVAGHGAFGEGRGAKPRHPQHGRAA